MPLTGYQTQVYPVAKSCSSPVPHKRERVTFVVREDCGSTALGTTLGSASKFSCNFRQDFFPSLGLSFLT